MNPKDPEVRQGAVSDSRTNDNETGKRPGTSVTSVNRNSAASSRARIGELDHRYNTSTVISWLCGEGGIQGGGFQDRCISLVPWTH